MLKKRGRRRLWAVLGTMLLAAALGVCALAASDVPKAVLNARESVVRIVTEGAMGSGFALSENSVYVVTNHHVIEGAETIEVIVDDTRWTTAPVLSFTHILVMTQPYSMTATRMPAAFSRIYW